MKRFIILFIVAILAAAGFGATYYVDTTNGSDAYDGTAPARVGETSEGPKKTICGNSDNDGAFSLVSADGDVIELVAGVYSIANGQKFGTPSATVLAVPAYNITIQPYNNGAVTIGAAGETFTGSGYFAITSDNDGKTCTFKNMSIVAGKTGAWFLYWDSTNDHNFVFDNCTITQGNAAGGLACSSFGGETNGTARRLTLQNGTTYTSAAATSLNIIHGQYNRITVTDSSITMAASTTKNILYLLYDMGDVRIYNSTFTYSATTGTCFNIASDFIESFSIENSTIAITNSGNGGRGISFSNVPCRGALNIRKNTITHNGSTTLYGFGLYISDYTAANIVRPTIIGNTITSTNYADGGRGIILTGANAPVVADNTISGFEYGILATKAADAKFLNNKIISAEACIAVYGSPQIIIQNNYCKAMEAGDNRVIVLGRSSYITEVTPDEYTATTAVDASWIDGGSGSDLDDVATDRTMLVIVEDTSGLASPNAVWWGLITGTNTTTGTITVEAWYDRDDAVETPTGTTYVTVAKFCEWATVTHNILDANVTNSVLTWDFNPRAGFCYVDKNIYNMYSALMNLDSGVQDTLAEVQAAWLAFSLSYPYNDKYSKLQNPGSKTGLYLDMDADGVKEWVGIPQSSGGKSTILNPSGGTTLNP